MPLPPATSTPPVQIFWTSGWDSTYRVIDLALRLEKEVQPYYVYDPERASTPLEIQTMEEIRAALRARAPEAAARIRPLETIRRDEIGPDPRFEPMSGRLKVGSQYEWLARLAEERDFDGVEMCAVKGRGNLYPLLKSETQLVEGPGGPTYRLVDSPSRPELELFRRFSFPLLDLSKPEMRALADERGLLDVMKMTWFCFEPKGGKPCGHCAPCMVALRSGMSWRIPPLRRIRPRLRLVKKALRR